MDASAGYGGLQQPAGGYVDAGAGGDASPNYKAPQNPTSSNVQPDAGASPTGLANGVNLQPSYSLGGNVDLGWDVMAKYPNIKTVRIEIEAGQEGNAQRWIKEAVNNKYTVVATYHNDVVMHNPALNSTAAELQKAAAWWAANYSQFKQSGNFTINLMNEWGEHAISADDFAAAYNTAIGMVRAVYSGPIIVDCPGFGQEAHTAALAAAKITDRNIILSMHLYPDGNKTAQTLPLVTKDIDELAATNLNCIVGEFGENGLSIGGKGVKTDWNQLVRYAKSKGWPVFGWAWCGDGGIMNMIEPKTFLPFTPGPVQLPASRYAIKPYLTNTIYPLL